MPDTKRLQDHFYIKLGGSENAELMADQIEVVVDNSLQLPDMATVTVHDTKLKWIDESSVKLGSEIKISAKSEAGTGDLFTGEIVGIEPTFRTGDQRLTIRAMDKLHRLTRGKKSRTYQNMTDGDIVNKIASESGLSADVGSEANIVYKHVYQHNQTDFEFLHERASRLGYVIYYKDSKLSFKKPAATGAEIELKWGDTLLEFNLRLASAAQVSTSIARGWDYANNQEIKGTATNGDGQPAIGESKPGGQASEDAFGVSAEAVNVNRVYRAAKEAESVAKAELEERITDYIMCDGSCKGNPKIVAGAKIKIQNIGRRFSGTWVVTTAKHIIDHSQHGYTTEFHCRGHHPDSVINELKDERGPSLGERNAIGIVTNNDDPDKMGRVKVRFPWHSPDIESNWARLVTPGAGKERGVQFLPEVNDEVLVAFELGDVDHPYVLGGLWNGSDKVAKDGVVNSGKIEQRVIKSRSGHIITLDDKDGGGGVYIEDKNGNHIRLESNGDKLLIKTQGNVEIETQADLKVKASGNISLEASQEIELKASTGVTVDGGAKVEVKGQMVNIN